MTSSPRPREETIRQRPLEIVRDRVVVGEGKDEVDLVRHVLGNLRDQVQVVDARGRDNIARLLRLVARSDGFRSARSLGVVLDADEDPVEAFTRTAHAMERAGLPRPPRAEEVTDGPVRCGVFVLPGQGRAGSVEDVYLPMVDPRREEAAQAHLDAVVAAGVDGPRRRGKGLLQAVLAALPRSPRHPGDGLQHGLSHDRSPLAPLQDFVSALCPSTTTPVTDDG